MRWSPTITVADMHCEGTPARIVTGGVLPPPGDSVQQQMVHMRDHDDWLRRFLLNEPRGAGISSANLIVPPKHPKADAGYIIMETVEYPPMSGSNTISTAAALIELGILPMAGDEARFTLESPAGLIPIHARRDEAGALEIEFTNQPAFVLALDHPLEVEGLGTIAVDVAYGGMFFAIADAHALGFSVTPDEGRDIVAAGTRITGAAIEQIEAAHPTEPEFRGISLSQIACPITDSPDGGKASCNACVVQRLRRAARAHRPQPHGHGHLRAARRDARPGADRRRRAFRQPLDHRHPLRGPGDRGDQGWRTPCRHPDHRRARLAGGPHPVRHRPVGSLPRGLPPRRLGRPAKMAPQGAS